MKRGGPTELLLNWLATQPPASDFSAQELSLVMGVCMKRTLETLARMYSNGQLSRAGEWGAYRYRLPGVALETIWKPDVIRPLVPSMGVVCWSTVVLRRAA